MIRRLDIPALGLPSTLSTGGRSGQGGQWWTACGIRKKDCDDVAENDYIYTIKSDFVASNPDFVQYITDQCAGAGEIAVKKMMGDYCIYCDGVLFGLICDNNFYIKVTDPGKTLLKEVILRPPYDGAKDYFYISDVDDRDYLVALIKGTIPALK